MLIKDTFPLPVSRQASTSGPSSPIWYVDSAATNHTTIDLNNLSLCSSYRGNDIVTVGNCSSLNLKNILHFPHLLTKKDNNCRLIFVW